MSKAYQSGRFATRRRSRMKWTHILHIVIILLVLFGMYIPFRDKIAEARGVKDNYCINEESYYYRIEQGLIFSNKVETTKDMSDGIDWKCLEWEEEPSIGKGFFGQKLIHKKGCILPQSNETKVKK